MQLLRLQRLATLDLQAQRDELNLRPTAFVTTSQTLSLHFGSTPPASLVRGREYSVRLYVSNEFGLWSRAISHCYEQGYSGSNISTPRVCCDVLHVKEQRGAPKVLIRYASHFYLGENGRVDFVFSVEESAAQVCDDEEECVMLTFFCDGPLPSGQLVAPIVSLPLFIVAPPPGLMHAPAKDMLAGSCEKAARGSGIQAVLASCLELCGQSIKIFDPVPHWHGTVAPGLLVPGRIYALECPGSLGIGGVGVHLVV